MSEDQEKGPPKDLPMETIERAREGDPSAFRELFHFYNPTVRWAVGLRVFRWPELVQMFDDIVQEVWYELSRRDFKRLRYYTGDRDVPFHRYLAFITTRLGWKIAKRHLEHPRVETVDVPEVDEGFEMKLMQADFLKQLARLVDERLDATDRRIFYGYYVRGERLKDIAAELGMTEEAIYQRHRRLLKKLRDLADELLDGSKGGNSDLIAISLAAFVTLAQGGTSEDIFEGSETLRDSLPVAEVEVEHE